MNTVKAFQCEFCRRKVMMNKTHMTEHEFLCFHNPRRRACQTCGNLSKEAETVYNPHHGGNPGSTDYEEVISWCTPREKDIYKLAIWKRHECEFWKLKTTNSGA